MAVESSVFAFFRTFMRTHCSVELQEDREYLVEARLQPLARARSYGSVEELMTALQARRTPGLQDEVIDALTTHETSFLRDRSVYNALRQSILPTLAERARARGSDNIVAWSCASSTGQEAYSVAITAMEAQARMQGVRLSVIGTDISSQVVEKARSGIYSDAELARGISGELKRRYFTAKGRDWQVCSSLRNMVSFRLANLAKDVPVASNIDLVLLRNVLIYFTIETRRGILARIARSQSRDGYLVLGCSESPLNLNSEYESVMIDGAQFYRLSEKR